AASGRKILIPCPVLEAGRPGSPMVAASRAATIAKGHADPACTVAEANSKFPAFALPPDWDVVVQDGGAILLSEVALSVMRSRAGAHVIAEPAKVDFRSDCVHIRTPDREVLAQRVILALGPWIGRALPLFILDRGPGDIVYGFPDFEGRGVKAAPHNHGPVPDADAWGPPATDTEL